MIRFRRSIVVALVATLLVTAGCTMATGDAIGSENESNSEGENDAIDADEILEAIEATETYRFELNQSIESPDGTVTMTGEGTVDEANERLYMSMASATDVAPGGGGDVEQYIVGDTQYVEIQGVWHRMNVSELSVWEDGNDQLGEQADVIEAGELEVVGTETVDGVETTVVRVDATEALVDELEESRTADANGLQTDETGALGAEIEDATYHYYVDEETNLLHRTEMEVTTTERGETVTTTMEMRFFDHDEPVDVDLPAEAEDAEPIDPPQAEGSGPTTP